MIDLVRKIQAEKDAVPKQKLYRTKRPLFSHATIKIFRCVMDNPGITPTELFVKAEVSRSFASCSMLEFYHQDLMKRVKGTCGNGILYRYSILGSKISANTLLEEEEVKLNRPTITGRMEEIFNLIIKSGARTVRQVCDSLGIRQQNVRAYINKLLKMGMIEKIKLDGRGLQYAYSIPEVK